MNLDVTVFEDGQIAFLHDEPFEGDVVRVEYYTDTQQIVVVSTKDPDGMLMEWETEPAIALALRKTDTVMVMYVRDGDIIGGFEAPLFCLKAEN